MAKGAGASLGILLGGLGKPPREKAEAVEADEAMGENDDALVGVADDILAAFGDNDSAALADALKAFVSMC